MHKVEARRVKHRQELVRRPTPNFQEVHDILARREPVLMLKDKAFERTR